MNLTKKQGLRIFDENFLWGCATHQSDSWVCLQTGYNPFTSISIGKMMINQCIEWGSKSLDRPQAVMIHDSIFLAVTNIFSV